MSKNDKIAKLKEYIKNFVIKELEKDEELEEVSTTATAGIDGTGTGHYDTPKAFASSASGSQGGHPKPDVVGYKKVNEATKQEVNALKKFIRDFDKMQKQYWNIAKMGDKELTNSKYNKHYETILAAQKSIVQLAREIQEKERIGEGLNEGYGEMMDELEKIYRPSGAPPIAKQALKDLADEYDIGRVLYAARTNEKSFREVLDMKIDQLQSQHVNKKHIDTIKRGKKLKEVTDKEITSLQKLYKGAYDLRKGYIKITSMGDKELRDKKYNKNYEAILKLETVLMNLIRELISKKRLGEGLNEGRYHDWRNDESMTPKQKVGRSMREIRDALNELDKTVKMNLKLKTELKMKSEDYWKNTHKALTKISERLVKMANKVGNLK